MFKDKIMKKLLLMATLAAAPLMVTSVQAADTSTKITFAKDSYCGSFTGNIKNGKVFRLWLASDQNLVIRNVGDDRINMAYVSGPSGRLDGDRYDNETSYITESKGNHYMKVYGNSSHSSVEFCAY
jgi:hypothetical protein